MSMKIIFIEKMQLTNEVKNQLDVVLENGKTIQLDWCHNLSRGSNADTNVSKELQTQLYKLAKKTMKTIGLRFASVDIVKLKEGSTAANHFHVPSNRLLVLEVNSNVCVSNYITQHPEEVKKAIAMYSEAVGLYFQDVKQRQ